MIKKLFSLFILTSFLFSFIAESADFQLKSETGVEHKLTSEHSSSEVPTFRNNDCEDCEDCNCGDHAAHCSHHCSGVHNIASAKNQISLNTPVSLSDKVLWYYNHHYKTPFIDPALKPPLHS